MLTLCKTVSKHSKTTYVLKTDFWGLKYGFLAKTMMWSVRLMGSDTVQFTFSSLIHTYLKQSMHEFGWIEWVDRFVYTLNSCYKWNGVSLSPFILIFCTWKDVTTLNNMFKYLDRETAELNTKGVIIDSMFLKQREI